MTPYGTSSTPTILDNLGAFDFAADSPDRGEITRVQGDARHEHLSENLDIQRCKSRYFIEYHLLTTYTPKYSPFSGAYALDTV